MWYSFHLIIILIGFVSAASQKCLNFLNSDNNNIEDKVKKCFTTSLTLSPCRGINDIKCLCTSDDYKNDLFQCILEENKYSGLGVAEFMAKICKNPKEPEETCLEAPKLSIPPAKELPPPKVLDDPIPEYEDLITILNVDPEGECSCDRPKKKPDETQTKTTSKPEPKPTHGQTKICDGDVPKTCTVICTTSKSMKPKPTSSLSTCTTEILCSSTKEDDPPIKPESGSNLLRIGIINIIFIYSLIFCWYY